MFSYFEFMRHFWDFAFENPEKIKPAHCALYAYCIEHCNRLGWKEKFGLPSQMAKEAIGIRSYKTYINALRDLRDFGFIVILENSHNQYSSNIIALVNFTEAHTKALDKAITKASPNHTPKQVQTTSESKYTIDRPNTLLPITNIPITLDKENSEIFTAKEVVDFVNENFQKEFSERNLGKLDLDLINDLVTLYGYTKEKILFAWGNIKKDEFYRSKQFNMVTFRHLSETKTIERFVSWKDELETPKNNTNGTAKQPIDWEKRDREFIERVMGSGEINAGSEGSNNEPFTSFEDA